MTNNGEMKSCLSQYCENCQFKVVKNDVSCNKNRVDWLYEEHSLLTDEEREYLKAVIKPFKDGLNGITFTDLGIYFSYKDEYIRSLPVTFKNKNINNDRKYSLEELGL